MLLQWEKNFYKNLNLTIPLLTVLLIISGLFLISSAVSVNNMQINAFNFVWRQLAAVFIGIAIIIAIQFVDYRIIKYEAWFLYLLSIGLLVFLLFVAEDISGARRWLSIGPLSFQPSELSKVFLILFLAAILEDKEDELKKMKGLIKPFIYMLFPFVLIFMQNDLGTALVVGVIFLVMLYIAGANKKYLLIFILLVIMLTFLLALFHFVFEIDVPFLQPYQLNRLLVFVNPQIDPQGIGYNIIQSKIALGSGGLTGRGWFAGTQNQLNFLPEKHTDFIFSVLGEEFGFLGVFILMFLYFLLLWQIINVALETKNKFGKLMVSGIAAMFFFHIFENIGMTMGVMPITGIPLPFISYGGSSIIAFLVCIGLIINVNINKKKLTF